MQTLQKDELILETLFVKGNPSVTRSSRLRPRKRGDQEESEDDSLVVNSEKSSCVPEDQQFYGIIVMEGTEVRFQLDSGAKANVMSLKTYNNLWRRPATCIPLTKTNTCQFPSLSTD